MADEEDNPLDRPVILFGKDIRRIPCFRDSILYGIGSGLFGGIAAFMFTSRPKFAADCMVGTFGIVSFGYFVVCRQRWAHEKFSMGQIRGAMRGALVLDNTEQNNTDKKVETVDV